MQLAEYDQNTARRVFEKLRNGNMAALFTDEELEFIAHCPGEDGKGTFMDAAIIDEYGLDVASGENTWPKVAAHMKARKAAWRAAHPGYPDAQLAKERGFLNTASDVVSAMRPGEMEALRDKLTGHILAEHQQSQ